MLHRELDELLACWVASTRGLVLGRTVGELVEWSCAQAGGKCERSGCGRPVAYEGARFCGAACSVQHEAGQ